METGVLLLLGVTSREPKREDDGATAGRGSYTRHIVFNLSLRAM